MHFNNYFNHIFFVLTLLISIFFIGYTQTNIDTAYGDFYVFLTMHELWHNNHQLYSEIWDHKDLGFYLINHIFYMIFGTFGLFLFTLICLMVFYFSTQRLFNDIETELTFFLSLITIYFVVSIDSFISTHGETQSILLFLSGILLFKKNIYFSILLIFMALIIKISTLFLILSFIIYLFLTKQNIKNFTFTFFYSLFIGFFLLVPFLILIYFNQNFFTGWIEVIEFNKYYAETIRSNKIFSLDSTNLTVDIIRIFFSFTIHTKILFLLCPILFVLISLNYKRISEINLIYFYRFSLLFVLILISILFSLYLQIPPAFHHLQYLNTLLVLYIFFSILILMHSFVIIKKIFIIILPLFILLNIEYKSITNNFNNFFNPPNGIFYEEMSKLPNDSTFTIFGGNHVKIDFSILNTQAKLNCRFFYQLEHIIEAYHEEIVKCSKELSDLVFVFNDEELMKIFYGKFYNEINANITSAIKQKKLTKCNISNEQKYFIIFSKNEEICNIFL